jgi:branched-chain amino acid transport system substrate-binding protein
MPKDLNDLTAFFTKVKALGPDVLLISGHEKGAATAARQIGELKVSAPLIGMTHCESGKVLSDFSSVAQGLVCPTQWSESTQTNDALFGTSSNYDKEMKAAHPEYKVVPYQTTEASVAVYVWKDAFERAQSLDQEKVRDALTKTDLQTICGRIKFANDGSNPGKDMIMRQIQTGKYAVVWPTSVAEAKLIYPREAHY